MNQSIPTALLALALAALALDAAAQTAPDQSWASKSGLASLSPAAAWPERDDLRDRLMIQDAFARWGVAYDEARLDVVRSLFTPDAIYEVTLGSAKPIASATGPEAITQVVKTTLAQQKDQRRHAISNVVIDQLDGRRAKAMGYGIVIVAADGLTLGATVIYIGELQKGPDGAWRFSRFVIGLDDYAGRKPKP